MHDFTHIYEYVHTRAHILYTVKFFKTQEKHIRETYICKKTIPNSLLGNAYWVVILLVCRWEGKKFSSPKQEATAQAQSNGRVPAAQESEVERPLEPTSSRQACTMQAPLLPPNKMAVSPSSCPNDQAGCKAQLQSVNGAGVGALGEKRPFQSEFIGRSRPKKKKKQSWKLLHKIEFSLQPFAFSKLAISYLRLNIPLEGCNRASLCIPSWLAAQELPAHTVSAGTAGVPHHA